MNNRLVELENGYNRKYKQMQEKILWLEDEV